MKFSKKLSLFLALAMSMSFSKITLASSKDSLPDLYNPNFKPIPATVLSKEQAENDSNVNVSMIRQENEKITFMVKDENGVMKPFYPKGLETGFWDTRKQGQTTDWDKVFKDFKDMGLNTVQLMIHWSDWEPENDKFDYTFLDNIVKKAAENDLKIYFAIFFHYQWNMDTKYDNFWAYHLEDKDGKNYSIMWGQGSLNNIANIRRNSLEVFPEYWHPTLYPELMQAINNLATHYKDSSNVIAYQLGNEEGFNYYLNNGNDTNPYYKQLFDKWKRETGKTDEGQFRLQTIENLWKNMTTEIHKVDPYKPTITNFQGGLPEKIGGFNWNEGVTPSFYKDANLDLVGPMFYGNDGYKIWNNLDPIYDYTKKLPLLFPSEIGAAGTKSIAMKTYLMDSLVRGASGFGIYCYGEMLGTPHEINLRKLLRMINETEDIIHSGLPVKSANESKNIFLSTDTSSAKVGNLEKDVNSNLGLLYFPDVVRYNSSEANKNVNMKLSVKDAGTYIIKTYTDGVLVSTTSKEIKANDSYNWTVNMSNYANTFIKVTNASVEDESTSTNSNIALYKTITSDSSETANPPVNANDGSEFTRWCAADGNTNHWLKVDLGESHNISGTEINWEMNNAYKYKIEVSNDNSNWTTVLDRTNNSVSSNNNKDSFTASGRYLRVTITGGVSSKVWASINELKVLKK